MRTMPTGERQRKPMPTLRLQIRPRLVGGVAGVEEQRRSIVAEKKVIELYGREREIPAADRGAIGIGRSELFVFVAADASITAREEALRRRQSRELVSTDGAVFRAEQETCPVAERTHDGARRMQAQEARR